FDPRVAPPGNIHVGDHDIDAAAILDPDTRSGGLRALLSAFKTKARDPYIVVGRRDVVETTNLKQRLRLVRREDARPARVRSSRLELTHDHRIDALRGRCRFGTRIAERHAVHAIGKPGGWGSCDVAPDSRTRRRRLIERSDAREDDAARDVD